MLPSNQKVCPPLLKWMKKLFLPMGLRLIPEIKFLTDQTTEDLVKKGYITYRDSRSVEELMDRI